MGPHGKIFLRWYFELKKATVYLKIMFFGIRRSGFYALSVVYTRSPIALYKK